MNKLLYATVAVALLASCASSYNVTGSSSVSALDGSKLYLKALKDGQVKNIDSCDVVHGEFHFAGLLDSVRMANLYMDDESILPVILEEGDIRVQIGPGGPSVGGTPLNDSLYKFIDKHNQLINQMNELGHKQNQMILEGIDEQTIDQQLDAEATQIAAIEDELFMMITSQYRYPILTPQIEYIMSKATKSFKNDPYVKEYYQMAQENEKRMNGLSDVAGSQVEQPRPQTDSLVTQPVTPLTNVPQK